MDLSACLFYLDSSSSGITKRMLIIFDDSLIFAICTDQVTSSIHLQVL